MTNGFEIIVISARTTNKNNQSPRPRKFSTNATCDDKISNFNKHETAKGLIDILLL